MASRKTHSSKEWILAAVITGLFLMLLLATLAVIQQKQYIRKSQEAMASPKNQVTQAPVESSAMEY